MIISPKHKLMFFKTRKTASTSTEVAIRNCMAASAGGFDPDATCTEIVVRGKTEQVFPELNNEITKFKQHVGPRKSVLAEMTLEEHKSYFKFMNVRNPYERVVSCYYYRKKWSKSSVTADTTFEQFVSDMCSSRILTMQPLYPWAIRCDDFIRYENFDADLVRVLGKWFDTTDMNIPQIKTKHRPAPKKHYKEYYGTETYDLVSKRYDKDLAFFEYEY